MKLFRHTGPRTAAAAALALAAAAWAGAAQAAVVTQPAVASGGFQSSNGGAFTTYFFLDVGQHDQDEFRAVLEFALPVLPPAASITQAQFGFRAPRPDLVGTIAIDGYAGDGVVAVGDLTAGALVASHAPATPTIEFVDVTAFVQGLFAGGATHAGFALRQDPFGVCANTSAQGFHHCSGGIDSLNALTAPQLVITYDESATAPEPAAWALLLLGFAAAGAALRRRRVAPA